MQKLDVHITQETLERNFLKLNQILQKNEYSLQVFNDLLTDEQKARIAAMDKVIERVNKFIEDRIRALNSQVNQMIIQQQELAAELEVAINETISSVEENIRADTQNAIEVLDKAKVSGVEFTETVNRLVQVDEENRSIIDQLPGKITLAVGKVEDKLNGAPGNSYSSIAALKIESDNLSAVVQSNKKDADGKLSTLTSDLNLVPGKITAAVTAAENKMTTKIAAVELDVDGLHTTVAANKKDADGKITTQATRIDQLPDKINLSVTTTPASSSLIPNLANLRLDINGLTSTVSNQGGQISTLQQRAGSIEATVAKKADVASLQVTDNSISAIITNLGQDPSESPYAAITLLKKTVDVCVKDKDLNGENVVSRINLSPAGVRISGRLIQMDGDVVFNNNVTILGKLLTAEAMANPNVNTVSSAHSFGKNGYVFFTNGLILQWTYGWAGSSYDDSGGSAKLYWPRTFPNACLSAVVGCGNGAGLGGFNERYASVSGYKNSDYYVLGIGY